MTHRDAIFGIGAPLYFAEAEDLSANLHPLIQLHLTGFHLISSQFVDLQASQQFDRFTLRNARRYQGKGAVFVEFVHKVMAHERWITARRYARQPTAMLVDVVDVRHGLCLHEAWL